MRITRFARYVFIRPFREGGLLKSVFRFPLFVSQWRAFQKQSKMPVRLADWYPCLHDATDTTPFDPHYFFQSAWVARRIAKSIPARHVDIGSQINLIAPLSAFVETDFVDLRPLQVSLKGLTSTRGSILQLPCASRSVESLSCLHVVEHIGLGRYGDALNIDGTKEACRELQRVLAVDGNLYLSLPVGVERVEFNAHRIHNPQTILDFFGELKLAVFSCVDDNGTFHENVQPSFCDEMQYALGMFHLVRPADRV